MVRGIWGGTSPERFIPPRGSRGESLLKMTGRPSHGDLQENCSFVKISTCVLACDLINCLLVSWLPVPSSRVEPVYLRAIADRITPFLELAFHFFYPGNYLQHYCSASASAPVIIEKFLFCGLYLDLFVPKTSASSFRRGFDASVSHSQCGCEWNIWNCSPLEYNARGWVEKEVTGKLWFRTKLYSEVPNQNAE